MSLSDRLAALNDLRLRGLLTEAEFTLAKARVIEAEGASSPISAPAVPPASPPSQAAPLPPRPVTPGVGLALGSASVANGGLFS